MGKILDCGCGGTDCCCVPRVIHEWVGCADLDSYFDQSTMSLGTLASGGCAPCNTLSCDTTMGWRIVKYSASGTTETPDGSGDCGVWDYSIKTIESGDIIAISGDCFFERCCPSLGNNNFCPSGYCTDIDDNSFQLHFGCDGIWPDITDIERHSWPEDCCVIADTFVDASGTALASHTTDTGHSWTAIHAAGTLINQDNVAQAYDGGGPDNNGFWIDLGSVDQDVSCTVTNDPCCGPAGIVIRGTGSGGGSPELIGVIMTDEWGVLTNWELQVATVSVGGFGEYVYTSVYSYDMGGDESGNTHDIRAVISGGRIKVYLDGVLRIDEVETAAMYPSNGTYVGILSEFSSAGQSKNDDFCAKIAAECQKGIRNNETY